MTELMPEYCAGLMAAEPPTTIKLVMPSALMVAAAWADRVVPSPLVRMIGKCLAKAYGPAPRASGKFSPVARMPVGPVLPLTVTVAAVWPVWVSTASAVS